MRKDFYYRLTTGGRLHLDPLRKDTKKITRLMKEFENINGVHIVPDLKKFYRKYSWPGNVRQLLGHLEQKHVLAGGGKLIYCSLDDELSQNLLEDEVLKSYQDVKTLDEMKKVYIFKMYEKIGCSIKRTARALGVSPNTVRTVIKEFNLQ